MCPVTEILNTTALTACPQSSQEQKEKGYSITQRSFTLSKWLLLEPLGPRGDTNGILEITTQWRGVVSPGELTTDIGISYSCSCLPEFQHAQFRGKEARNASLSPLFSDPPLRSLGTLVSALMPSPTRLTCTVARSRERECFLCTAGRASSTLG